MTLNDWWTLSPDEWTAIRLSLLVATVAMVASLPFGLGVGWRSPGGSSGESRS